MSSPGVKHDLDQFDHPLPPPPIAAHDIITSTVREQGVKAPDTPGYSTTNYSILGEMLTALTGQSPEDTLNALAAEVGLSDSAMPTAGTATMPPPASAGYVNDNAVASMKRDGIDIDTRRCLRLRPILGRRWWRHVLDRRGPRSLGCDRLRQHAPAKGLGDQRLTTQPIPEGVGYGLGIIDYGNGWYGHSGEILGWNSMAANNPETGAALTMIINESGSLGTAASAILPAFPTLISAFGG